MAKAAATKIAADQVDAVVTASSESVPAPAKAADTIMRVLDTTALIDPTNPVNRIHAQIINGSVHQFTFKPGEGTPLPREVALKFLQHDGFKLVDENNQEMAYKRPPRQQEDLQAGETLKLADDETVARYDELHNEALLKRVGAMLGGEKFARTAPNRSAIIKFIVEGKKKTVVAKKSKEPDVKSDEFVPAPDFDEEVAA